MTQARRAKDAMVVARIQRAWLPLAVSTVAEFFTTQQTARVPSAFPANQ